MTKPANITVLISFRYRSATGEPAGFFPPCEVCGQEWRVNLPRELVKRDDYESALVAAEVYKQTCTNYGCSCQYGK